MGITLTQPWATLVAAGRKRVETRDWTTEYRGPLAIHAAKGLSGLDPLVGRRAKEYDLAALANEEPYRAALTDAGYADADGRVDAARLPRAAVVATCTLYAVRPAAEQWAAMLRWVEAADPAARPGRGQAVALELSLGDYGPGRYAFVFRDVRALPVPVTIPKGAVRYYRGLWRVPDATVAEVGA